MLKYGFFDSVEGDRVYGAEDFSLFYEGMLSDGIIRGVASEMEVVPGEGMSVMAGTGKAVIGGRWLRNTEPYRLELAETDSYYNRIDLVVARVNYEARTAELAVKMGTPAVQPVAPALENSSRIKEILLARLLIPKNAATVTADKIIDCRTYASVDNLKNEAVRYTSGRAFFAAAGRNTVGMQFYQRTGQVVVDALTVNGSRIVKAELHAEKTTVPKKGDGYLGVKILMPPDLGNIPVSAPVSVTVEADQGVQLTGRLVDDLGRIFFVLANTEAEEKFLDGITVSYMMLDEPEEKTY